MITQEIVDRFERLQKRQIWTDEECKFLKQKWITEEEAKRDLQELKRNLVNVITKIK